ncbi:MAG: methylated-DNA--[protein]-cysteine S-methyltransferase [Phycisphaeraceae bacterium]|nr:methylated-DNA--[protein]-cysteine S-methyltransferase [Phycisphaeraceae bacterium]
MVAPVCRVARWAPGAPRAYRAGQGRAAAMGRARAARAVGRANGRNPAAIVVPCHRVIGAGGALTGYGGGLERKRWLLAHEGCAAHGPSQGKFRQLAKSGGVRAPWPGAWRCPCRRGSWRR